MRPCGQRPLIEPARQLELTREYLQTDIGLKEMAEREGVTTGSIQYYVKKHRAEIEAEQEREEAAR